MEYRMSTVTEVIVALTGLATAVSIAMTAYNTILTAQAKAAALNAEANSAKAEATAVAAKTEMKQDLVLVKEDVRKIEIATNSMKDALVEAVRSEATLQGKTDEKARADAEKSVDAASRAAQRAEDKAAASKEEPYP